MDFKELITQEISITKLDLSGASIFDPHSTKPFYSDQNGSIHIQLYHNIIGDFFAKHPKIKDLKWLSLQNVSMTRKISLKYGSRSAIKYLLDNIKEHGQLETFILTNTIKYKCLTEVTHIADFIQNNKYLKELYRTHKLARPKHIRVNSCGTYKFKC